MKNHPVLVLNLLLGLRLFGLFSVLPVLSLHVSRMAGATPLLAGTAVGIYGLTQALFQLPLGIWSDRAGRKTVMTIGLVLFVAGSLLALAASSIGLIIAGRALQGVGAIGSVTMAFLADLVPSTERARTMAMTGMSIGLSFFLAMTAGPLLVSWTGVRGLFGMAALLGVTCLFLLHVCLPESDRQTPATPSAFFPHRMLFLPKLNALYGGIFVLHAVFTAIFFILPLHLTQVADLPIHRQWTLYLPVMTMGFVMAVLLVSLAEKKRLFRPFFLGSILLTNTGILLLWLSAGNLSLHAGGIFCFFAGFSALEAFIPARVSRLAPESHRGAAMGIHASAQFAGIFAGGVSSGWLYGHFGFSGVHVFGILLLLVWAAQVAVSRQTALPGISASRFPGNSLSETSPEI